MGTCAHVQAVTFDVLIDNLLKVEPALSTLRILITPTSIIGKTSNQYCYPVLSVGDVSCFQARPLLLKWADCAHYIVLEFTTMFAEAITGTCLP